MDFWNDSLNVKIYPPQKNLFTVSGFNNYEGENEMEKERILGLIKNEMGSVPLPMENLADLDIRLLGNHLAEKKAAYSTVNALEFKMKNLIALAVGIALDSQSCIMTNVKAAKKNGASTEEILEVFAIAKFSKSASSMSSYGPAMEWLLDEGK